MNTRFAEPEAQPIAAPVVPFPRMLERHGLSLPRTPLEILQVNLTARCNLACTHCHVESGPKREEALDARGIDRLIELMSTAPALQTLDLTGGAPELHPQFRRLAAAGRAHGLKVIDRCNLTVLFEPGQESLAEFLTAQRVEVETGAVEGGFVEILSGLAAGDRVVGSGLNRIQPGAPVTVAGRGGQAAAPGAAAR